MSENKKPNYFFILFGILAFIGVLILMAFSTRWMISQWGELGKSDGKVPLSNPVRIPSSWKLGGFGRGLESTLNWIFAPDGSSLTWQMLLLQVIILIIFGVSFSDILTQFSTFRERTASLLGWLLAAIAALTGMVRFTMVWLGLTAGIGAIGIGIIFVNAIVVFVLMNLFIGNRAIKSMKSARDLREIQSKARSTKNAFAGARATVDAINRGNAEGARS